MGCTEMAIQTGMKVMYMDTDVTVVHLEKH